MQNNKKKLMRRASGIVVLGALAFVACNEMKEVNVGTASDFICAAGNPCDPTASCQSPADGQNYVCQGGVLVTNPDACVVDGSCTGSFKAATCCTGMPVGAFLACDGSVWGQVDPSPSAACNCPTTHYCADADSDGYGDPNVSQDMCSGAAAPAGFVTDCTDCNDADPLVNPGMTEVCYNGVDDNCNTLVDENCNPCHATLACVPDNPPPLQTNCWDFDTSTELGCCYDNTCAATTWTTLAAIGDSCPVPACDTGLPGVCAAGTTDCTDGPVCVQTTASSAETCNGVDDDCDGTIDNGNPGGGAACDTGLLGACAAGTMTCVGGSLSCVENVASGPEVCGNAVDEDCDGALDNGCFADSIRWTVPVGYVQSGAVTAIGDIQDPSLGYIGRWTLGVPLCVLADQGGGVFACDLSSYGMTSGAVINYTVQHVDAACPLGVAWAFDQGDYACGACLGLGQCTMNAGACNALLGTDELILAGVLQPLNLVDNSDGQVCTWNNMGTKP